MKPSKKRIKAIQAAEKKLAELSNELQRKYYNSVWRAISPSVRRDNAITLVAANDIFVRAWQRIVGRGINKFLKEELRELGILSAAYYSQYPPVILDFKDIEKIVNQGMEQNLSNFATQYTASMDVATRVRSFAITAIQTQTSMADIRTTLEAEMLGTESKLGVVDNYNLVKLRVQDTFAEYDRRTSNQYATQLNLNYFIYQGGEIRTTREFCEERNGNVYTREEGIAFDSLTWEGKKPNNNFLVDCGGYNCRHYLDWISYELAQQLRPSIERSIYDTNGLQN
jgi:hypothetical protein